MLGIDYGSDSEPEETISITPTKPSAVSKQTANTSSASSSTAASSSKSKTGLVLPPPRSSSTAKGGSKKVVIELPKLSKLSDDEEDENDRATKKPRLDSGGGGRGSSLFSMLPEPKKASVQPKGAAERVLGGGRQGLGGAALAFSTSMPNMTTSTTPSSSTNEEGTGIDQDDAEEGQSSTSLIPPSLALAKAKGKGKSNTSKSTPQGPSLFSIGLFPEPASSSAKDTTSLSEPLAISITAAPQIEDFRPPSPTIADSYPGYYQLPSGKWAQHDPEYYQRYTDKWTKEYNSQIRQLEKQQSKRGFEGAFKEESTMDVSGEEQLDSARKEREDRKALTKGTWREAQPAMPNMKINPQKAGGLARTRHQLSTMLTDAYMNREAMEEKIAQAKRNRKESGNKYGF